MNIHQFMHIFRVTLTKTWKSGVIRNDKIHIRWTGKGKVAWTWTISCLIRKCYKCAIIHSFIFLHPLYFIHFNNNQKVFFQPIISKQPVSILLHIFLFFWIDLLLHLLLHNHLIRITSIAFSGTSIKFVTYKSCTT